VKPKQSVNVGPKERKITGHKGGSTWYVGGVPGIGMWSIKREE